MGQMSNQSEREGHAMKLAETIMQAHGGLNSHSNFSKEYPMYIKMSICMARYKSEMLARFCSITE